MQQKLDKTTRKYRHKCRGIMLRLAVLDRKKREPILSYDDLLLPFQDYHCLDLREKGLVTLGMDAFGRPGVALHRNFRGLEPSAFMEVLDWKIGKEY